MVASNSKARKSPPQARKSPPQARNSAPKARESAPQPGRPARGSTTGRPVMALLDLLGRRWSLRVLWELRSGEGCTFRELQARCAEVSSSVLNDRLRELREAGIVAATTGSGYALTAEGMRLLQALEPLDGWAKRWAHGAAADNQAAAPPVNSGALAGVAQSVRAAES
jgi:DNA-binding HxlR family transcriptional regulator